MFPAKYPGVDYVRKMYLDKSIRWDRQLGNKVTAIIIWQYSVDLENACYHLVENLLYLKM
jgi:hypothetical protein